MRISQVRGNLGRLGFGPSCRRDDQTHRCGGSAEGKPVTEVASTAVGLVPRGGATRVTGRATLSLASLPWGWCPGETRQRRPLPPVTTGTCGFPGKGGSAERPPLDSRSCPLLPLPPPERAVAALEITLWTLRAAGAENRKLSAEVTLLERPYPSSCLPSSSFSPCGATSPPSSLTGDRGPRGPKPSAHKV